MISYLPSQPQFELETKSYTEQKVKFKQNQSSILFYQFQTGELSNQISVVPDGYLDILINCHNEHQANICGSVTKSKAISLSPNSTYFGIRFLPCLDAQTVKHDIKDLIDQEIPLTDMLPVNRSTLERIANKESFTEKVNVFNETVGNLIFKADTSTRLIKQMLHDIHATKGNITITRLAEKTGYSARYLRKQFKDHIGISPKLFGQIVRFQSSLSMLLRTSHCKMVDVIYENGYYDQAHLIHEFRKFGYMTPYQLIDQKNCQITS